MTKGRRTKDDLHVTQYGVVIDSRNGKIIPQCIDGAGYSNVTACVDGKYTMLLVHRLVAEIYCHQESEDLVEVDHINGNKQDNRYTNLQWITPQGNAEKANAKYYVMVSPTGVVENIYNMKKFCRLKGLDSSNMFRVFHDKQKQYKGWTKYYG